MEQTVEILKMLLSDNMLTIVAVVYFLMEAIKKIEFVNNKYIPLLSMFVGLIVGVILAIVSNNGDIYTSAVLGFLSGGFTSGLYKLINPNFDKDK